jgi:hypothetical protein
METTEQTGWREIRGVHVGRSEEEGTVRHGLIVPEEEGRFRAYVVVEETSRWWILFFRPYFHRYTVFQGPEGEESALVEELRGILAGGASPLPRGYTQIARIVDPEEPVLDVAEDAVTLRLPPGR